MFTMASQVPKTIRYLLRRFPAPTFPTSPLYSVLSTKPPDDAFEICQLILLLCLKYFHFPRLVFKSPSNGLHNLAPYSLSGLPPLCPHTPFLPHPCFPQAHRAHSCFGVFAKHILQTHVALSFRSLLTCHLVTPFKIANSTLISSSSSLSLTHLTFLHST